MPYRDTKPSGHGLTRGAPEMELQLWSEETVRQLMRTAYRFWDGEAVLLEQGCAPADALESAHRILGPRAEFSHLLEGMPVYVNTGPRA